MLRRLSGNDNYLKIAQRWIDPSYEGTHSRSALKAEGKKYIYIYISEWWSVYRDIVKIWKLYVVIRRRRKKGTCCRKVDGWKPRLRGRRATRLGVPGALAQIDDKPPRILSNIRLLFPGSRRVASRRSSDTSSTEKKSWRWREEGWASCVAEHGGVQAPLGKLTEHLWAFTSCSVIAFDPPSDLF